MKNIKVKINFNLVTEDTVSEKDYQTLLKDKKYAEIKLANQFKSLFDAKGDLKVTVEVEDDSE